MLSPQEGAKDHVQAGPEQLQYEATRQLRPLVLVDCFQWQRPEEELSEEGEARVGLRVPWESTSLNPGAQTQRRHTGHRRCCCSCRFSLRQVPKRMDPHRGEVQPAPGPPPLQVLGTGLPWPPSAQAPSSPRQAQPGPEAAGPGFDAGLRVQTDPPGSGAQRSCLAGPGQGWDSRAWGVCPLRGRRGQGRTREGKRALHPMPQWGPTQGSCSHWRPRAARPWDAHWASPE